LELKVGDRVRYVVQRDIDNVKVGEVGIIRDISSGGDYAVDFEESGFKHNCGGLCRDNHGWWCSGDTLEPVDSKTLRMTDGTIIGEFNTGGLVSIHDLQTDALSDWATNVQLDKETVFNGLSQVLKRATEVYSSTKEEKNLKFTFYVTEGTRVDKSCNGTIPTMTTNIELLSGNVFDKVTTVKGSATCDKADYDERQGVLEALANAICGGNFYKAYAEAVKLNRCEDELSRTCIYCGKVLNTVEEKQAHEAWHVERKKARRERYLLRKRAKEIAFEEQAQKMAKEMIGEQK